MKQSLNGAWQITRTTPGVAEPMTFTGTVPGCVLNDLLRNGYGPENVFWRDHAEQVQHFENDSWCYRRVFSVSEPTDHVELVFERLDTYCDVYLNGKYVGSGDNGYIPHRFSVGDQLQTGENSVEVYFQSPIVRTAGQKPSSGAFTTERIRTRRVQCTYGWDWTMRFVTCGIGDAALEFPEAQPMRPEHVYVYTKCVDEDGAALGIDVRFAEPCTGALLTFRVCDDQNQTVYSEERWCAEPFLRLNPDIAHPKLWYPAGYGAQPLYRLIIQWGDRVLHTTEFGIRTVRILQLKDEPGTTYHTRCMELKTTDFSERYDQNAEFSGFVLKINGVKILCRGANWVPCEPFTTDGIPQKITRHLEMAKEAGVNMLRVWGGGAIECEHFYDECARLGILVTQDFLMACGRYPEEEDWFIEALQKEATYATLLLRNKDCLLWWSGDNENAVGGTDLDENYPGRRSAYKGIAPILYKLDPHRAFFPSSPYGGRKYASHTVGTTHNTHFLSFFFKWLEESDLSDYKEMLQKYSARFIAEEPTMGACSWNTLKTFMTEADILGDDNRMWLYHTKGNPALQRDLMEYMELFAEKVLGAYTDGADRFFSS